MADAGAGVIDRTIKLQVAAARQEESGHGIARMPKSAMAALGITEGDTVQIVGKRSTAARAVLATMEAEDVPARAERAGARLTESLSSLDGVAEVRGLGLLIAAELDGLDARTVVADALAGGLIANAVTPSAIRLAPSLLVTDDEIDRASTILGAALEQAASS